jgi:hypothetical protein
MRKGRSTAARTPKKPADAEAGAVLVRKFAIKLFDRDEGEAANWRLIAESAAAQRSLSLHRTNSCDRPFSVSRRRPLGAGCQRTVRVYS